MHAWLNHPWIKDPLSGQDRFIDYHGTDYKKYSAMLSDCTLQLTFKKIRIAKFYVA